MLPLILTGRKRGNEYKARHGFNMEEVFVTSQTVDFFNPAVLACDLSTFELAKDAKDSRGSGERCKNNCK